MGWFFKGKKDAPSVQSTKAQISRSAVVIPTYRAVVNVDCFDARVQQRGVRVNVGDRGFIECNVASTDKHANVVVRIGGVDVGYLPYKVGDTLRAIYSTKQQPCVVSAVSYDGTATLSVEVSLPFIYGEKNLPMFACVNTPTSEQCFLKQSACGDYLTIKYNSATSKYDVINNAIANTIGTVSAEQADKVLKKFGVGTILHGVITKIATSFDGGTMFAYIYLLTREG